MSKKTLSQLTFDSNLAQMSPDLCRRVFNETHCLQITTWEKQSE